MWSVCHVLFGSEVHFRLTAFSILLIQSAFLKVSLTFVYFFNFLDTYHRVMGLFSDISVAVLYILFTVSQIYPHFVFNCPCKNPMVRGADTAESWTQLSPPTLPSNWSLLELIFVFKPTLVVCYKPLHSLIWLSRVHLMWFCLSILLEHISSRGSEGKRLMVLSISGHVICMKKEGFQYIHQRAANTASCRTRAPITQNSCDIVRETDALS